MYETVCAVIVVYAFSHIFRRFSLFWGIDFRSIAFGEIRRQLLDEIDAALDNKNVISLVNVLRSFANVSQYIVITHNTKTAMGAYTMIGVTMEESGVTKVVQMRKDEDTLNANIPYEADDNFVEEDVEPEEGVVLPPRPPRREHNPDGSLNIPQEPVQETSETQEKVQTEEESADTGDNDVETGEKEGFDQENPENSSTNQGSDIDANANSMENID